MDGVGIGRRDEGDAVWLATTPTLDRLAAGSWQPLHAHGRAVGLPSDGDMGNSEVGHNILGAGRVFGQGATLVDHAMRSGDLVAGETWDWLVGPLGRTGAALHLVGLLSDGNVHSHQDHLHALLAGAAASGCRRAYVHALLDGRDVPPVSAEVYLDRLERDLAAHREAGRDYRIASGGGRMVVTMDRYEADWAMVERGWQAHVLGEGRSFGSAIEAVETFRRERPGTIDQYLPAFVVADDDGPVAPVEDGDAVILCNFRGDRAIQITRAFVGEVPFDRKRRPELRFAGMMQYDGDTGLPPRFLVQPPRVIETLSEYLASSGLRQLACAETQKFGHVTYFWNGNRSGMFDSRLERYIEVPSDSLPFDQRPEMKAAEVTAATIEALRSPDRPDFLRLNYANGDMVGHTGDLKATVRSIEAMDQALGRLLAELGALGGAALGLPLGWAVRGCTCCFPQRRRPGSQ